MILHGVDCMLPLADNFRACRSVWGLRLDRPDWTGESSDVGEYALRMPLSRWHSHYNCTAHARRLGAPVNCSIVRYSTLSSPAPSHLGGRLSDCPSFHSDIN